MNVSFDDNPGAIAKANEPGPTSRDDVFHLFLPGRVAQTSAGGSRKERVISKLVGWQETAGAAARLS